MRKLIFAFPGMGKTPTCRRLPNCMDLDFGMFRNALRCKKEQETKIFPEFTTLIKSYLDENWRVFTNEPKLLNFWYYGVDDVNLCSQAVMFLPIRKGIAYCAKKMQVSTSQIEKWVDGWKHCAELAHVPIIEISVGLDHYLAACEEF